MTRQEVYDYIVAQLAVPVILIEKFLNSFSKVLDFITESTVSDIIPDWTNALTFNTDGTGAGKYCKHPDTNGKKRIFETKTSANVNNQPPTDPAIIENAYWIEISQSSGSSIKEWAAGLYGTGLVIVYHNHSTHGRGLALLLDPTRPFDSTDIEAEMTAGKWEFIAISKPYVDSKVSGSESVEMYARMFEDFDLGPVGYFNTTSFNNGGGLGGTVQVPAFGQDGVENAVGVLGFPTGSSTAGGCALANTAYRHPVGFGATHTLTFRAALEALSDGVNTYHVRLGYMNAFQTAASATSGIYFRYSHGVNGGRWQAVTVNGTETAADTGVAAVAGSFSIFKIVVNSAGTQVDFYIDGVLTNSITTNIPTSTGNVVGQAAVIEKTLGSTSRSLYLDYVEKIVQRTTAR